MIISVNILVWNNKDTIEKTLTNIEFDLKDIAHEYIIVDNGSTDGSVDIISNWIAANLSNNFTFVRNKENLGISIGKNRAISLSRGEYIFMCDGDVVPVRNSIRLLLDEVERSGKDALGMLPNKFVTSWLDAEQWCDELVTIKPHKCACLFYGLYRRSIFDNGLRMCEEGEMGKPGYGWEDHDFFKRMEASGVKQYAANINSERGRYYHAINSSIRAMGREKYMETSRLRSKHFKEIWEGDNASRQSSSKPPRRTGRTRRKDTKRDRNNDTIT